jgi:hypothetical protein
VFKVNEESTAVAKDSVKCLAVSEPVIFAHLATFFVFTFL